MSVFAEICFLLLLLVLVHARLGTIELTGNVTCGEVSIPEGTNATASVCVNGTNLLPPHFRDPLKEFLVVRDDWEPYEAVRRLRETPCGPAGVCIFFFFFLVGGAQSASGSDTEQVCASARELSLAVT